MLEPELASAMYLDMLRIRLVEEGIADLYPEQEMRWLEIKSSHFCWGGVLH